MYPIFQTEYSPLTAADRRILCGIATVLLLVVSTVVACTAPQSVRSIVAYMFVMTALCFCAFLLEHRAVRKARSTQAQS